jgi:ABC-type multidrug transport system fused ATPase/permease subunit
MMQTNSVPIILVVVIALFVFLQWRGVGMEQWQAFLNSLATPGGYIIVLFVMLLIGWRLFQFDPTAGGSIMTLSSGAILRGITDEKKNKKDSPEGSGVAP